MSDFTPRMKPEASDVKGHVTFNIIHQNNIQINNIFTNGENLYRKANLNGEADQYATNGAEYVKRRKGDLSVARPHSKTVKERDVSALFGGLSPRLKTRQFLIPRGMSAKEVTMVEKDVEASEKMTEYVATRGEITVLGDEYLAEMSGYLLLVLIAVFFAIGMFWMFFVKLIDLKTDNALLSFLRDDQYYCWLVPLLLPTTTLLIYANWVAMKFFRHN